MNFKSIFFEFLKSLVISQSRKHHLYIKPTEKWKLEGLKLVFSKRCASKIWGGSPIKKNSAPSPWKGRKTTSSATFCTTGVCGLRRARRSWFQNKLFLNFVNMYSLFTASFWRTICFVYVCLKILHATRLNSIKSFRKFIFKLQIKSEWTGTWVGLGPVRIRSPSAWEQV